MPPIALPQPARDMKWRNTKAFERLTMRMLLLIGVGTLVNLGFLMHLKSSGEFGAQNRRTPQDARCQLNACTHAMP